MLPHFPQFVEGGPQCIGLFLAIVVQGTERRRNLEQPQLTQPGAGVPVESVGNLVVALGIAELPRTERDRANKREAGHQAHQAGLVQGVISEGELQQAVVVREVRYKVANDDEVEGKEGRASDVDHFQPGEGIDVQLGLAGLESAAHKQHLLLKACNVKNKKNDTLLSAD